jgi:hypothetical protein
MSRIKIFRNTYIGTGLITVVGTSFATLSTGFAVSALGGIHVLILLSTSPTHLQYTVC